MAKPPLGFLVDLKWQHVAGRAFAPTTDEWAPTLLQLPRVLGWMAQSSVQEITFVPAALCQAAPAQLPGPFAHLPARCGPL